MNLMNLKLKVLKPKKDSFCIEEFLKESRRDLKDFNLPEVKQLFMNRPLDQFTRI
jgi:hypothetical protein